MKLMFATANAGKVKEVQEICDTLGREYGLEVVVEPMPVKYDIPETGDTYEENSLQKASFVLEKYGCDCIADDSGMEVDALDGGPGIYTARYCGHDFGKGIYKLLDALKEKGAMEPSQRRAAFVCCITVILGGQVHQFKGVCPGTISLEPHGVCGFGFDPVFIPGAGPGVCMAELPDADKNKLSHRGLAMRKLFEFLKTLG